MPILQSLRFPDKTVSVSLQTWERMKKNGHSKRWKVIGNADIERTIRDAPPDVIEFMKRSKDSLSETVSPITERFTEPVTTAPTEKPLRQWTRAEIIGYLESNNIQYDKRLSKSLLIKLVETHKQ